MKVAVYARVSTVGKGQDPDTQLIPLRQYISNRGWEIYQEYIDVGVSGTKDSRPELNQMLMDAKQRKFDCVVVWKFDRLARSLRHLINVLNDFNSLGIQFISMTEAVDTSIPTGKLLFSILGALSEFERDLIVERVRAGISKAKAKGVRLGRRTGTKVDIHEIYRLRKEGLTVRDIAVRMNISKSSAASFVQKIPVENGNNSV